MKKEEWDFIIAEHFVFVQRWLWPLVFLMLGCFAAGYIVGHGGI